MHVDGECLCGALRFEAQIDPNRVIVCNCTDCQTHSGSAFRTVALADPESFRVTRGTLKIFQKTAESGRGRVLSFCPECGTPVHGGPLEGEEGYVSLRVGTLRQRAELAPVARVWCRSEQSWLEGLNDLPKLEKQPGV